MAALAADMELPHFGNPTKITVKSAVADIFYAGACVYAAAAGGATPVGAASLPFLGICAKQVNAAIGDRVDIYIDGVFKVGALAHALVVGDIGQQLVADASAAGTLTDNILDKVTGPDATIVATDILIGQIMALEDDGGALIAIRKGNGVYSAVGAA